jgi:hypothetical protein
MNEELILAIQALTKATQALEKILTSTLAQDSETLSSAQAARVLNCSKRTLETYRKNWIEGVHYFRKAKGYCYNRVLLEDWLKNQFDPNAHQIVIESWLRSQPSNQKIK